MLPSPFPPAALRFGNAGCSLACKRHLLNEATGQSPALTQSLLSPNHPALRTVIRRERAKNTQTRNELSSVSLLYGLWSQKSWG